MSDVSGLLWLIPALPLAAAVLTALLGPKVLRAQSHWPCVLATASACVVSLFVFAAVYSAGAEHPSQVVPYYTVFHAGSVNVEFSLRADALTALMLVMITFIGTLIAIFSIGYMHGELNGGHGHDAHGHDAHDAPASPNYGYPRFFAEVSLFIFSMTMLVLADNLLILYAGWEGVGLCSYLLVGFWFTKPAAANAARKAFLVTRIGDVGLFLGIMLLWLGSGYHLDYETVFREFPQNAGGFREYYLTLACLLLLSGAAGKSAQFPLHVWLPDAMEGPTPVSALIHAATMVTAGVYLIARCTPLFVQAPVAQLVVACVGCFTALFAALIALTQNDLKRHRFGVFHAEIARLYVSRPRLRDWLRRLLFPDGLPQGSERRRPPSPRRCSTCSRMPFSKRFFSSPPAASCTRWATSSTCAALAACVK